MTTGRLDFGVRIYRDPRFATRAWGQPADAMVGQRYRSTAR